MPTPLTPDEEVRFLRAMADHIAQKLAAGERFRVSLTDETAHLYSGITSLVADRLGRPVTGFTNGREYFITLPEPEALDS